MTEAPPASPRALRERLKPLAPAERLARLRDLMRQEAEGGRPRTPVLSLIAAQPALLREACGPLLEEPANRLYALRILARLHNRHEQLPELRAVLRALVEACPEDRELRREWLRACLLGPDTAEADWELGKPGLNRVSALSYGVQWRVARGAPPAPEALMQALDGRLAALDRGGFPPALARIAAAREVALVGNGSATHGKGLGAEIDSHDCVVRVNFPVLTGFEADVGTRTDVMVFAEAKRRELPALAAREPWHAALLALALHTAPLEEALRRDPPGLPRPVGALVADLAYPNPSTGFHAILLIAAVLRRPLALYGFDFFRAGGPGHYYGPATAAQQHELAYERWFTERALPLLGTWLRRGPDS